MIVDPILLAGPSITHREIECVADAAAIGWNMRDVEYIHKLQNTMRAYTGHRFAFATANRTCAMHLAMLALGIGPGHEVLVPEIADISAALCVTHVGAKPVFCDVDPLTLCLCPRSAAAKITPAARAIIPVHMYGQPCDMDALLDLAEKHALAVVEDAAQGLGSLYKGRRAGSFGLFTVFSFNGREAVVSGEGGMLLTSDEKLMARAAKLGSQGRSQDSPFVYDEAGFNYAMSNVQAALGYAQMERLAALLEKKEQIHGWYRDRLNGFPGVRLNAELEEYSASYLMNVLFVDDPTLLRTEFMRRLQASKVLCRPVPYPLSTQPVFASIAGAVSTENPVAYSTGARALLLPSGHNRTEEEVEYVCATVMTLLADRQSPRAAVAPTGWLKYKSDVLETLARIKTEGLVLPFTHEGAEYELRALTGKDAGDPEVIRFLADFRRENMHVFLRHHEVTDEFMRETMSNYVDRARDFLLFFVAKGNILHGHMGLDDFAFQKRECLAEGFMMRKDAPRGLAAAAADAMYAWARETLGIVRVYNHVVGSNKPVRLLAASQGFREINRTALYKQEYPDGAVFRPMYIQGHDQPDEYFVFSAKDL